ncbi:hypothetical protein WEN_00635 [Mycoplasma wenyonii str. Massachusetts]|uniref:Uncharacterized protein n=1 Tax=Mycoplasma wenyonii (strain Massachusetts) TaxID=1197325 RepID=I6ZEC6_MYCWM|nr:hypothetical protein [Mycoplasma wenyonii]AFN64932.1 hypothetical protein WEN_00635 [Mycoplasma wenyonii str. Massachusetts]
MSLIIGKLALLTLVPVVGAGIAYPTMTTKFGGGEGQIRLTSIGDFENNCWVSVQGTLSKGGEETAKLLACRVKKDSEVARFYFFVKTADSVNLPKEVKNVTYQNGDGHGHKFLVTFSDGESKTINASNTIWNSVFGDEINRNCKITGDVTTSRRLGCNGQYPQNMEFFKSNSQ